MNKLYYLIDCYWMLDNLFMMLANNDDDVCKQWMENYLEYPGMLWYSIVDIRELELNLDSFGCLDADL